jgi:hypothetical protein
MNDATVNSTLSTQPRIDAKRFYMAMAATCAVVAFIGFAPSYWIPMVTGTQPQPFLVHLHGLLFSGWTLFFLLQTSLVASGNTARHREIGLAGIALASIMFCVGILMTIHSLHINIALGFPQAAKAFSIVSFSAIILFAAFVAIAIANVHNRELHKRLMLLVTVSMLQPAIGRWFLLFLRPPGAVGPPPVEVTLGPGLVADLLIIAAMIYDRKTRGRIHPAYWVGGGVIFAVQVLRVPLSHTATWLSVADWFAAASL